MPDLKLIAFDDADLAVVSAHAQDAILRVCDIDWRPKERRAVLALNRFAWEAPADALAAAAPKLPAGALGFAPARPVARARAGERRHAAVTIKHVSGVRSHGIRRDAPDGVLSLLAVTFEPGDAPGGTIRLVFAGGGEIRVDVECLEVQLCDLGTAWAARARPCHDEAGRDEVA